MIVRMSGEDWRVTLVNESRAHCVPVKSKEKVVIKDWEGGVRRTFWKPRRGMDISPNSEVEIVGCK